MPPNHPAEPLSPAFAREFPELAAGIERGFVSFTALVAADWARRDAATAPDRLQLLADAYPLVLTAFEAAHGVVVDWFSDPGTRCAAARTSARLLPARPGGSALAPARAGAPDFHIVYDLALAPVAGPVLARLDMMGTDACRLLRSEKLIDCLDQLYSQATDLFGIIASAQSALAAAPARRSAGDPGAKCCAAPAPAAGPDLASKIAIVEHELDVIQFKYLITQARLLYLLGAAASTAVLVLAVVAAAAAGHWLSFPDAGRAFYLALGLSAAGALLSVLQRMSSDSLAVRYDVGTVYILLLGGFRPVIGAGAGLLLWMLVEGRVILSPADSDFVLGALALAAGAAERTIGDVATQTGLLDRLSPTKPGPSGSTSTAQRHPPAP